MTEQNTVSCATKKVCYGGPEIVKVMCPKHYVETDALRDRRKGRGEQLQTWIPSRCIFHAACSAQDFWWVRARPRSAMPFCHPKKPPATVLHLPSLWHINDAIGLQNNFAKMGHICSKARLRAMDIK